MSRHLGSKRSTRTQNYRTDRSEGTATNFKDPTNILFKRALIINLIKCTDSPQKHQTRSKKLQQ